MALMEGLAGSYATGNSDVMLGDAESPPEVSSSFHPQTSPATRVASTTAMALTSWKSFNFFTASAVPTGELFENSDITALATGSDQLFLGTGSGHIQILNSSFKVVREFPVHDGSDSSGAAVTHIHQIEGTALLLTITEDLSSEPLLKVWALDKLEKKTGLPRCQSSLRVNNGRKQFPISAFATTPSLSLLAVGFGNGSITLIRGDLIHDRGTKQRVIFENEEPITNLCFSPPSSRMASGYHTMPGAGGGDTLYVATTARILTLITAGRGAGQPARVLENQGCSVGCMTSAVDFSSDERGLANEGGDIVVARDDALYFYGPNGRGACYSYEGPKQLVQVFRNYIALITPPSSRPSTAVQSHRPGGVSNTLRRMIGAGATDAEDPFDLTKFTLLDTELKFVAHSERVVAGVKQLFISWKDIFALTHDGKLYRYHEISLQEKLEILYTRNLYVLAINLAQKAGVADSKLLGIYRRYADYLYGKGDYDGSMQWYIKSLSPSAEEGVSTVIRKFLDAQRIHNLVEYLEELHRQRIATSDHTTLLLNCYAKSKDVDKLESFIKSSSASAEDGGQLAFDVDTAIAMCRQAGYFDQACYLAEQHGEHATVVSILVENLSRTADGLAYIRRLDPSDTYENLMRHAGPFLRELPQDTTGLFIEYYTGRYVARKEIPLEESAAAAQAPQEGGRLSSYLNSNALALRQLPYGLVVGGTSATNSPANTGGQSTSQAGEATTVPLELPKPYKPPAPRTAFSSFVDHPAEFILFLEQILSSLSERLPANDKVDIYTTLFEMYLQRAKTSSSPAEKAEWEAKAQATIASKDALLDTSNVLLLSHLADFAAGTTAVREQHGLRFDIFRAYCSARDTEGAIAALKKYGDEEPLLYPAALQYLTSAPEVLHAAGDDELRRVLRVIDERGLMQPLQVVQALSSNAVATVGLVRRYLADTIARERREIANNRRMVETYKQETARKLGEIAELGGLPTHFQSQTCVACNTALDLPAVHFLCKHSFHQRCLNVPGGGSEEELECVVCAPTNQTIRTLRASQDEMAERHEYFRTQLAESRDKFATVAAFYGKGVMVQGPVV